MRSTIVLLVIITIGFSSIIQTKHRLQASSGNHAASPSNSSSELHQQNQSRTDAPSLSTIKTLLAQKYSQEVNGSGSATPPADLHKTANIMKDSLKQYHSQMMKMYQERKAQTTNEADGNGNVDRGLNNSIKGQDNIVYKGNDNKVKGKENLIEGSNNRVQGTGNIVMSLPPGTQPPGFDLSFIDHLRPPRPIPIYPNSKKDELTSKSQKIDKLPVNEKQQKSTKIEPKSQPNPPKEIKQDVAKISIKQEANKKDNVTSLESNDKTKEVTNISEKQTIGKEVPKIQQKQQDKILVVKKEIKDEQKLIDKNMTQQAETETKSEPKGKLNDEQNKQTMSKEFQCESYNKTSSEPEIIRSISIQSHIIQPKLQPERTAGGSSSSESKAALIQEISLAPASVSSDTKISNKANSVAMSSSLWNFVSLSFVLILVFCL